MFTINKWKLALIIGIFILFGVYLIPTPSSFYGPIYGYLDVWMQQENGIPRPEVIEDEFVATKFDLSKTVLPSGINLQEAKTRLATILRDRLESFGFTEISEEQLSQTNLGINQFSFDTTEQTEFLVKFGRSKDEVEKILGKLQLYGSLPISMRRILPDRRINLGLDLRGGVYLVLELDAEETKEALLAERETSIKERMASERIAAREIERQVGRDALIVNVRVTPELLSRYSNSRELYLKKAEDVLKELQFFDDPNLIENSESLAKYSLRLDKSGLEEYSKYAIDQVLEVLRNRIDAFGVAEPSIRRDPNNPRIIIQLPGARGSSQALGVAKTMGRLEFKLVKQAQPVNADGNPIDTPLPEIPENCEIRYGDEDEWYLLEKEVLLTGEHIKSAGVQQEPGTFQLVVAMSFDSQGQRRFADITGANIGERLAILLDDKVKSAPVIRDKIRGNAQIEGNFTPDEANYLAKILKAGAFPVGVSVAEERTVGPTLGQEAIDNGAKAAIIGMALVVVFMIFYYRLSGAIAVVALIFDMEIILGALAGFGATLTLPGLAGLVLTIGMAVDANVLIFERIREELRTGKTVRASIDSGYRRAFWTILDANVTTLITALVLFQFGTGPIKGFAVTLSIGILASMFTALVMTKEMYSWIYHGKQIEKLSI
ncbi:TPA: protein translocase subunit SecD [Candidatus Poribacteria bacterium]|nr:protein translocase subunit SecD [Candidatus Poribacteria bacterium]